MNVLFAIESFYDGGAEMFAIRLANALCKKVNIFFLELKPYETEKKNQKKFLDQTIKVIQGGKTLHGNILQQHFFKGQLKKRVTHSYLSSIESKLLSVIKKYDINIVHSHSLQTDIYFSRLKDKVDFKLVSTMHGHYALEPADKLHQTFQQNNMFAGIDKYVFSTQQQTETLDMLGIPQKKRAKIFYGMEGTIANKLTEYEQNGPLKIIMTARGIEEKGWKEIIEACLILLKEFPGKISLELLGEGIFLDQLKAAYKNSQIQFRGYVDNVIPAITAVHIAVLPSYYKAESLPNSIIEYLFCGKPVIATRIGAVEEMISHNNEKAGTLINLVNGRVNVNDLANAVKVYLENPELVKQHSATALKAAQKFAMNNCAGSYVSLYHEMLNEHVVQQ